MAITKKNTCSIQTVVNQLEGLFDTFNEHFFNNELQKPVITVNPDVTKGAYGWCTSKKMKDNMKLTFVLNTLTDLLNRLQKPLFMKWYIF